MDDIHGGRRRDATSSGRVFRGPLCAIDYRCPSYLAGEARSFLREHAIFCSLAALSRATPLPCRSFTGYESSRNPQVQIVCIVRISDDISHYIKLRRVLLEREYDVNSDSIAAGYWKRGWTLPSALSPRQLLASCTLPSPFPTTLRSQPILLPQPLFVADESEAVCDNSFAERPNAPQFLFPFPFFRLCFDKFRHPVKSRRRSPKFSPEFISVCSEK